MLNFVNPLYITLQNRRNNNYKLYGFSVPNWSKQDVTKLGNVASKYGFPPQWLANLINFESGGTFNPAIKNPSSGATGLIQFMPQFFDTKKLSKMSVSQQIDEVDKYIGRVLSGRKEASKVFDKSKKKAKSNFTETDLFMTIFYPSAIGNPNYKFPRKVSSANGGISTPIDYTKKALSSSSIPFPNFPQKMIEPVEPKEEDDTKKPMPVGYRVLIFAGISLLAYLIYKKLGKDLAKSPIDLSNVKF